MGRCNIKHPQTGEWRCWSTIVDNWVSEWMSEADYKQWLVDEATRQAAAEIEAYGIKESRFQTYNDCLYKLAMREHCENCKDRFDKCDDCDYNITVEAYVEQGDDYFNLGILEP